LGLHWIFIVHVQNTLGDPKVAQITRPLKPGLWANAWAAMGSRIDVVLTIAHE
jgi:hypothetical protein